MWFYGLLAAGVVIWFVWWLRHPHHRRTGGGRYLDGKFPARHDVATGYQRDTPSPREHAAPGEYDGD